MSVLCAVLDKKSGLGLKPFFEESVAAAERGFTLIANEPGSPVNSFPDDYSLVQLGAYSPEGMVLSILTPPSLVCTARDVLRDTPFPSPLNSASIINEMRDAMQKHALEQKQYIGSILAKPKKKWWFS